MSDWAGMSGMLELVWLALHFCLYVVILRDRAFFRTEKGIFLYHLGSSAVFVAIAIVILLIRRDDEAFAVACALVAAHGIYSISFLELWSLAQGSYSLSIMGRGTAGAAPSRTELIDAFSRIGNMKKTDRLSGLERSKVIQLVGSVWMLNGIGGPVVVFLRGLLWLANIEERG